MIPSQMATRREFIGGIGALLGAVGCGSQQDREPRMNVLFLFPDQMRAQAMGCMGNPDVKTPNLDRLAAEGVLFRNHFANSPVCCPARAIILTGKYAHTNGMIANDLRLRESETSLAELFAEAGYRTGFVGKWHLDGGPRQPGWIPPGARRQGFEFWAANEVSHAHFDTQYFRDDPEPIPIKTFEASVWTDIGVEFLRQTKQDERPFFLTVQMGPPHDPYIAPDEYMALYDPDAIALRPNFDGDTSDRELVPSPYVETPGRKEIAAYYAMVTAVDDQVGRILGELDELGLRDNTIVIVSSDHGDMLGSHGTRLKRKPWEESIRVPGIVRHPGAPAGRETDALFSHVDIAPTLLSLCGLPVPPEMQGASLAPVVLGQAESGPSAAYFQIFGPFLAGGVERGWRGLRTDRFMYARTKDAPWVLYDLEADPYELKNLVADPEAGPTLAELDAELARWMEKTGDSWDFDWTAPIEDAGRLYKHEAFYTVEDFFEWAAENPELAQLP
ncbi:MAG: sulfatase [Acidobacteriia bacterium]|nr:sulfatase [Terriglobia bacterium]